MRSLPLFLAAATLAVAAAPAWADGGPGTAALCADPVVGCSVTTSAAHVRDATVVDVSITGAPDVTAEVQLYRAVLDGDRLQALEPVGPAVAFSTGGTGTARVRVPVSAVAGGREGGWLFVSLAGQSGPDVAGSIGQFVPFGARLPHLLGDGYTEEKPVGAPLELHVDGAAPSSDYRVEHLDGGRWVDVTDPADDAVHVARDPSAVSVVTYRVPRGLRGDVDHEFRLVNVTDHAVGASWTVRPTTTGTPAARIRQFVPPEVGTDLQGASRRARHPQGLVQVASLSVAAVATLAAVGVTGKVRSRG